MFPGEACGAGEDIAAFGAPVGAGNDMDVCAKATPAVIQKAAEASRARRIKISLIYSECDGRKFHRR
jgi:hypothetical protein